MAESQINSVAFTEIFVQIWPFCYEI